MSNSLDRICTVDISLASPISNDANFDNILILGPAPANPTGDVPAIGVYNSLEELTALGIAATGERADLLAWLHGWLFRSLPDPTRSMLPLWATSWTRRAKTPHCRP